MMPVLSGEYDVEGDEVVGYDVMGAPVLRSALRRGGVRPRPVRAALGVPMQAPGMPSPQLNRKLLPFRAETQGGIFTAVTDRIRYSARPQKTFQGERIVVDAFRAGAAATATRIRCSQFLVGTIPQMAQVSDFSMEMFDITRAGSLDMNIKMDPAKNGDDIFFDIFLVGVPFVPGTDSINLSISIIGQTIG
jgi:hypothetical protein